MFICFRDVSMPDDAMGRRLVTAQIIDENSIDVVTDGHWTDIE